MNRMKWWLLCWLVLSLVSYNFTLKNPDQNRGPKQDNSRGPGQNKDRDLDQHKDRGPGKDRDRDSDQDKDRGPGKDRDRGPGKDRDRDSDHDKDRDSDQDNDLYSDQGKDRGPGKDKDRDSDHDKDRDSDQDNDLYSDQGKDRGPGKDKDRDSDQDKDRDSDHDQNRDSDEDKDRDLDQDKDRGPGKDRDRDSDHDQDRDSDQDNDRDSGKDKDRDSDQDKDRGPGKDKDQDSDQDKDRDSDQDKDRDSDQDQDRDSDQDKDRDLDQDKDRGPGKDRDRDSDHDQDRDSDQDKDRGPGKDKDRDSDQDKDRGPGKDKDRGPGKDKDRDSDEDKDRHSDHDKGRGPGKDKYRGPGLGQNLCKRNRRNKPGVSDVKHCMEDVNSIMKNGTRHDSIQAIERLAQILEETEVDEILPISINRFMAVLHRPKGPFRGLKISASENEAVPDKAVTNSKVSVHLPRELDIGPNNTIVFCMLTWPEPSWTTWGATDVLYESRLVGLSVQGKNISGLQERVNITMNLTLAINETQKPSCVFFNFSTQEYSSDGCLTLWERGESHVTCSCDHLTYFGVLMVSASLSSTDLEILTYITLIGCSLSLFALVITVLLFITNKKVRADVSMKIHINLVIALILLNLHFLPSHMVAALSSAGLCLYMALSLHYSLLATFTWMALEGFHLYLLIVKVFNIYVRRYLLKLSMVGWGIPAVIISLVVIIDKDTYGSVPLDLSNSNSTAICYISNNTVKMVTTVGGFGLVFIFNVTMLGVAIRRIVSVHQECDRHRVKRDICTLLGLTTLLGITWGLAFFSFGYLTTPGLYLFCILNSLQGFFIFLWFVMSLRKNGNSAAKKSSETRSTSS